MGSPRMPLLLRLLALACALAALAVPAVAAAGEVTTTPTEEIPLGEATSEPVVPPVKEVSEKAAIPKHEGSGEEPVPAPQATAPTSTPTTTTGESSGSSSTPAATTPAKVPAGTTQASSSSTHSGGHEGSPGVQHVATSQAGTLPSPTGTAPPSTESGGEVAAEPSSTGASEVAGVATTSAEAARAEASTAPQPKAATVTPATADPPAAAKLDEAQAVEHSPAAKPAPSRSPLQTVGHALSRPFEEPTSTSALVAYLCLLLGALIIGVGFWFEIGGSPERAYWYRRKLIDTLGLGRRGRNAG
jgi:hypothetical protein